MTKTTIRRARACDAPLLAALGAKTFADAFGHLYPAEDLAAFIASTHTEEKIAGELADPAMAHWLAEREGEAVGYAVAGPCGLPHPEVTAACGELKRIYVSRTGQGEGLGTRLLAQALAWLERDSPRRLWIGVFSQNVGAQRLYERHGFRKVGDYVFVVGATRDPEFILSRG
ncbi:MAG TPA: GNAT family N-acetyltransferase [Caulobacteraceae bacterium]|jgi:ribosomal protein S18 acetylase RimI-like enzyme|nr:GNAT family N-acetyltransferase [Caulobacteraceae bacterium]